MNCINCKYALTEKFCYATHKDVYCPKRRAKQKSARKRQAMAKKKAKVKTILDGLLTLIEENQLKKGAQI